jgi:hypothetical protein
VRLFIDRQHQGMLGRVHVQPDPVLNPFSKLGIAGQLEGAHPMRLEAVGAPNALHAANADAAGRRHGVAAPVRRLAGRLVTRHLDHALDHVRRQGGDAGRARLVTQQPVDALLLDTALPAVHGRQRHSNVPCDGAVQTRAVAQQSDPGAWHQLLWGVAVANEVLQPTSVGGSEFQVNGPARDIHVPQRADILCRM